MRVFFLIALRNLLKHRGRTFILAGAITAIAFLLTVLLSLIAGIKSTMIRNGTALLTGHVNIGGFYKMSQSSAAPMVTDYEPLLKIAQKEVPEAELIIDRVKAYGKIISDSDSIQVPMWGISMEQEKTILGSLELAEAEDYIDKESSKDGPERKLEMGNLEELKERGTMALFAAHAKKLKVRVGDMVTVSLPTYRNMSNTKDVRVVAVLKDLGMMSQFSLFLHSDDAKEIYQVKNSTTGQIMIYLKNISDVPQVEDRLRKAIGKAGYELMEKDSTPFFMKFDRVAGESWTGQRIDVTTWEDETSFLKWIINLLSALTYFSVLILMIIVAIGLMNMIWISIRERTSEIGTLRAIGLQKSQVFYLFLLESLLITLTGSVLGSFLGVITSWNLNHLHLPIHSEALRIFLMSNILRFDVGVGAIFQVNFILVSFLTFGSLIPIWQASRLKPITAIQSAT